MSSDVCCMSVQGKSYMSLRFTPTARTLQMIAQAFIPVYVGAWLVTLCCQLGITRNASGAAGLDRERAVRRRRTDWGGSRGESPVMLQWPVGRLKLQPCNFNTIITLSSVRRKRGSLSGSEHKERSVHVLFASPLLNEVVSRFKDRQNSFRSPYTHSPVSVI